MQNLDSSTTLLQKNDYSTHLSFRVCKGKNMNKKYPSEVDTQNRMQMEACLTILAHDKSRSR